MKEFLSENNKSFDDFIFLLKKKCEEKENKKKFENSKKFSTLS